MLHLHNVTYLLIAILLATVYGCSSTNQAKPQSKAPTAEQIQKNIEQTAQQLYLRGSFNLWDYQNEYRLFKVNANTYSAAATLIKGQRYEFLFSAKDASKPNSNCGHTEKAQIPLNQKVTASCNNIVLESFVFMPPSDGTYEFFLEIHTINRPMVYIKKAF